MKESFLCSALIVFLHFHRALASPMVQESELERLKIKVGQFLLVGISDQQISKKTAAVLNELRPGALVLFKRNLRNAQQVRGLTSQLNTLSKSYSSTNLLLATDQEGGRVARIQTTPSMPSPLALGKTQDPKLVEEISFEVAKILRLLGFNINFAPVLDVLANNQSSFIAERSFGWDPRRVSELGIAFAKGQLRAGIIPTSKHFPGVGFLKRDPHVQGDIINDVSDLTIFPFKEFSTLSPSAVMMSHSIYPTLDIQGLPATFSKKIISDLLINKYNFKGLIITDDLQMGAAKISTDVGKLGLMSFLAGADLLMVTWGPKEQKLVRDEILHAVLRGEITEKYLDARLEKISKIKSSLLPPSRDLASVGSTESADHLNFQLEKLAAFDDEVLSKNLFQDLTAMPKIFSSKRFAVAASGIDFKSTFEKSLGKPVLFINSKSILTSSSNSLTLALSGADYLLFPIQSKKDFLYLSSLNKVVREKTVVINMSAPINFQFNDYFGVINLFHPHANVAKRLCDFIKGEKSQ